MSFETRFTEAAQTAARRLDEDLRARLTAFAGDLQDTLATAAAEVESRHATMMTALDEEIARLEAALEDREARLAALEASAAHDREVHQQALVEVRQDAAAALAEAESALTEAMKHAEAVQTPAADAAIAAIQESFAARLQSVAHATSAMDEAGTLSEVLDALADGLAAQAPRTAVLVFQNDRARLWRRHGFPADAPAVPELHVPGHADLAAVVTGAAPAIVDASPDGLVLGFVALPEGRQGLAVPVAIGGQVASLVYADGGDDPSAPGAGWANVVEVLARHAARCLETLTAMRAAGYTRAERPAVVVPMPPHLRVVQRQSLDIPVGDALEQARRVARLLVSEIRLNREADVVAGRAEGDLGVRLSGEIARARQQYLRRVPDAVPGRDTLFDEEVVRTLANGDAALLRTGS